MRIKEKNNIKIIVHETSVYGNVYRYDEDSDSYIKSGYYPELLSKDNSTERYSNEYIDPNTRIAVQFIADSRGVTQFGHITDMFYHVATFNKIAVAVERTVDESTNQEMAVYNQAKTVASIIESLIQERSYYSRFYPDVKEFTQEEIDSFIENNVICHSEISIGKNLDYIKEAIANYELLVKKYGDKIPRKALFEFDKVIIPSNVNNPDHPELQKICPGRLISGLYGGMARFKSIVRKCLDEYHKGNTDALFEEIVYGEIIHYENYGSIFDDDRVSLIKKG